VHVGGSAGEALFKMAVFNKIETEPDISVKKELSLKHQVLCDETAIIGVMKQTNKTTGELKETSIKFGKEALTDNMFGHQNFLHQPPMMPMPMPRCMPLSS
jgi:hypothetical protein